MRKACICKHHKWLCSLNLLSFHVAVMDKIHQICNWWRPSWSKHLLKVQYWSSSYVCYSLSIYPIILQFLTDFQCLCIKAAHFCFFGHNFIIIAIFSTGGAVFILSLCGSFFVENCLNFCLLHCCWYLLFLWLWGLRCKLKEMQHPNFMAYHITTQDPVYQLWVSWKMRPTLLLASVQHHWLSC